MKEDLDTIYIELVVTASQMDKVWMQGGIEIRIGNKKPYSEGDIVETEALLKSMKADGEYFIFSCCCGSHECGGWKKGIKVEHENEFVMWTDLNNGNKWMFDKKRMEEDILEIREEVTNYKKYFKEKEIEYVGVGYNWE